MKISIEMVYLLSIAQFINVAGVIFGRNFTALLCSLETLQH